MPTYDHRLDDLSETRLKPKEKLNEDKKELVRLFNIYGGDKEILYVQSLQVCRKIISVKVRTVFNGV